MNSTPVPAHARKAPPLPALRSRTVIPGQPSESLKSSPATEVWVVSTVHRPDDVRIFWKQAVSLAASGYAVTAVFWTGDPSSAKEETLAGVRRRVLWRGRKLPGPLSRFVVLLRTLHLCLRSGCRNFLIHDPELIPVGVLLNRAGKRVVFDAHEDLPVQTLHKAYLTSWQRPLIQALANGLFHSADRWLSGQLCATATIQHRFHARSCLVRNFPLLREFRTTNGTRRSNQIVYVGGLSAARGVFDLIVAVNRIPFEASLVLAGPWESDAFRTRCEAADIGNRVSYAGTLDRRSVAALLAQSTIGVAVLHPVPAYVEALPVKLFEYLAAGLPVIVSDFPLWRGIVASANCGVVVEPCKVDALQVALEYLLNNSDLREQMGINGRAAVEQRYTWEAESTGFLNFVGRVFGTPGASDPDESLALPA